MASEEPNYLTGGSEGKEGHFTAFLFTAVFSLMVGVIAKKLFTKWCAKHQLSLKEGLAILFLVCWFIGLVLIVLTYILYLLVLLIGLAH